MTKKKIFLLTAIALLAVIYVIQLTVITRGTGKEIKTKIDPDFITIENSLNHIELSKDNDSWFVGKEKFPAKNDSIKNLINACQNIRILDTVSKQSNQAVLSRYGLTDPVRVTLTGKGKGAPILLVGKTSTTGSQTYIKFEGKKEIYLCSSDMTSYFPLNQNNYVDYQIYKTTSSQIFKISQAAKDYSWTIEKAGEMADIQWKDADINNPKKLDSEKVNAWVETITELTAKEWSEEVDFASLPQETLNVTIHAAQDVIQLTLYPFTDKYLGTSNKCEYMFILAKEDGDKFIKTLDSF